MSAFRLVCLAVALAIGSCAPFAPPALPPVPGAGQTGPAPSWPMLAAAPDLDGQPLGDAQGKKTVAIVFASWCEHCHDTLAQLDRLRARPDVRVIGVNFRWQEEYDARGSSPALRAYVSRWAPWLRVVPGDDALWNALGQPPKVPTLYVFDAGGRLAAVYDRRARPAPGADELAQLLDTL